MPNLEIKNGFFKWFFYFALYIISSHAVVAQCPTLNPGDENQTFCDSDDPQISDLIANDNGGGIHWYDAPTGGNRLDELTALTNNVTYYADNDTNTCPKSPGVVERPGVTVTINGQEPSNVPVGVTLCAADTNTIAQLTADGDNIAWFLTETGGTQLTSTHPLQNGTRYYVQQTQAGCTSDRISTRVTITNPGPPTGDPEQFFCNDPNAPVTYRVSDLSAVGTDIQWFNSPTSTSPLNPFTPLINNASYYATQITDRCASTGRFETIVRIEDISNPGTDAVLEYCDNISGTIDLLVELGGDPGGIWAGPIALTNGEQGTLDRSLLDPGNFTFTYTIPAANACPEVSATLTINVQEEPDAGENGTLEICSNETSTDLFALLGGTPDAGGTWSGPSTLANGDQGTFDPSNDASGTYTYTVAPTNPCTVDATATIEVTVTTAPEAGNNANRSFCENDAPLDLFTLLGSSADTGGTWTPTLASGTGVFDPGTDSAGTYIYIVDPSATCPSDQATVAVTIEEQLFAGDDGFADLCRNDPAVDLFSFLGNNPDTGGAWSPALTSGTGVFEPGVDTAGTYTYTVTGAGACPDDTAVVNVSVNIERLAGNNATVSTCGSDAIFDLFSLLGAGADTGGTWTGPSTLTNSDAGTFDPATNISGTYRYTVVGTGACQDVSSNVVVTVINPTPDIIPDGNIFCIINNPVINDLITNINPENAGTIQIYDTPTGTVPLNGSDFLINGNTYYAGETDIPSGCEGTNRLEITIQINDPAIPQLSDAATTFCLIDAPTIEDLNAFVVSGDNIIWFDAAVSGNQFNETDSLVSGDYYAIEEDINGCRSLASDPISVLINDNPPPTLNPSGNALCGVDRPTIEQLEMNLTIENGLTVVWYDAEENGTVLNSTDLLLDNSTYYAATFNAVTGCESNDRLEITVDLTACDPSVYALLIPDGFSPNGDGINDVYDLRDVEFLFEDYTIEIYNRYGNMIFKGNNSVAPWDGTSNQADDFGNNIVPNGVYFYIFNFNRDNLSPQQGRIYLNR